MTTGFDQLPGELFPFIFNHLNMKYLIRSRLVCRRWRLLIDELMRWDELIFKSTTCPSYAEWFYTRKKIDYNRLIKTNSNMISIFENQLINLKLLKNVKRMMIISNSIYADSIYLKYLIKFTQLEQFELISDSYEQDTMINNANLKILKIFNFNLFSLELNTPKLQVLYLKCCPLYTIKFNYPLKLKYLKIFSGLFFKHIHHFRQLINLQTLEVRLGSDTELFEILISYPKLIRLIIASFCGNIIERRDKPKLIELLRKKKELNSRTQIQLDGQLIDSIDQLDKISFFSSR